MTPLQLSFELTEDDITRSLRYGVLATKPLQIVNGLFVAAGLAVIAYRFRSSGWPGGGFAGAALAV